MAASPITMTINDPSIAIGDSIYLVSSSGLTLVATATVAGQVTFTFTSDPIFLVTATKAKPPKLPGAVAVVFRLKRSALGSTERNALVALASKLTPGGTITVTGFAKDDVALAKQRAQTVAAFLTTRVKVHVAIKTVTNSSASKVVVTATKV